MALLQSFQRGQASEHIFPSPFTGHPFASLFYPWDRIRRRAGLPDVRLHDLRHSFASFLVNRGESLYVVQGLLGDSQIRMTQRYAHLAPRTLLGATEVVAEVIGSGHPNDALQDEGWISANSLTASSPLAPRSARRCCLRLSSDIRNRPRGDMRI